jgi:hypothetical protein
MQKAICIVGKQAHHASEVIVVKNVVQLKPFRPSTTKNILALKRH